jgi:hypothetical protein
LLDAVVETRWERGKGSAGYTGRRKRIKCESGRIKDKKEIIQGDSRANKLEKLLVVGQTD